MWLNQWEVDFLLNDLVELTSVFTLLNCYAMSVGFNIRTRLLRDVFFVLLVRQQYSNFFLSCQCQSVETLEC